MSDVGRGSGPSELGVAKTPRRVAIVHDWLASYSGAARCLEQLLLCYPDATLFSLFDILPESQRSFLGGRRPVTTCVQRLPFLARHYRRYFPLMPIAVEQIDLSEFDLIISSSWAVAKGVITGPDQLHICYCYTPVRYAWDLQNKYLVESGNERGLGSAIIRIMLHYIRLWDVRTASGVDEFIAISDFIGRRIRKCYGRASTTIHPPVDTEFYCLNDGREREDYYITASRMVPYKMIHKIIEAFKMLPDRRLVVVGDGPDMDLCRRAAGSNVEICGFLPRELLRDKIQGARAFLFMAEEDFGIAPVEAQACGTPVIAFAKGGALDSICGLDSDEPTGTFFFEQSAEALVAEILTFEENRHRISAEACRRNAERFSQSHYRSKIQEMISRSWECYRSNYRSV